MTRIERIQRRDQGVGGYDDIRTMQQDRRHLLTVARALAEALRRYVDRDKITKGGVLAYGDFQRAESALQLYDAEEPTDG
jgi:hypothetical protein